jgi:hypothetical protein
VKRIVALVAISALALATSCHTKNVGTGGPQFLAATITVPTNMFGNQDATWTANIQGGIGPFTVAWDFGGGATPNTATFTGQAGPTSSATVTMVNNTGANASYHAKVTVTDSLGVVFTTPDPGVAYTVGPIQNQPPVINSATWDATAKTITVSVSDPDDGENLSVTVTPPAGFTVDNATKTAAATGPLTAVFNVSADDLFAGGTGNFGVSVTDGTATTTSPTGVDVTIAPIALAADTLYAIPLTSTAAVGDKVTVVVATGIPANPFQYMNGCGLTMPSDGKYVGSTAPNGGTGDVPGSFNIGAVGGNQGDPDGIWAVMNPSGGFLLAPDNFITSTADQPAAGSERWDFNVTPLGGSNLTTASGALFNAQFEFSTAGTKTFGFQQFETVKRTYYSDDATEYFWGDITNNVGGVPNSVTVN